MSGTVNGSSLVVVAMVFITDTDSSALGSSVEVDEVDKNGTRDAAEEEDVDTDGGVETSTLSIVESLSESDGPVFILGFVYNMHNIQ